jgi:hypothetical protein
LASQVPIRTFSQWDAVGPGHLQLDLVGHDGGNASGMFCFTLCATDVCTGWVERRAILTKAARWVCEALEQILPVFPYPIVEIHPDNGSEFINRKLLSWCAERGLRMTRSRAGKKNDNCHVEQKNFDAVRKLVGYYRYAGEHSVELLNELYRTHGLLQNYVYPSQKLVSKVRHGSAVSKRHDAPQTPADRVLGCATNDGRTRWNIHARRQRLDPIELADTSRRLQKAVVEQASTLTATNSKDEGVSA